jgi:hypothetical protein
VAVEDAREAAGVHAGGDLTDAAPVGGVGQPGEQVDGGGGVVLGALAGVLEGDGVEAGERLGLGGDGPVALLADLGEAEGDDRDDHEDRDAATIELRAVATDEPDEVLPRGVAVGADDLAGLEPAQVVGERLGGGVAGVRAAGHRLVDDGDQLVGQFGGALLQRDGGLVDGLEKQRGDVVGVVGQAAGERVVEDGAEGEHVGARVGLGAVGLLGRHVAGGADDGADAGERVGRVRARRGGWPFGQVGRGGDVGDRAGSIDGAGSGRVVCGGSGREGCSWRGPEAAGSSVPSCLARPQSITTVSPNSPTSTLPGLRSRWMMPWAWA